MLANVIDRLLDLGVERGDTILAFGGALAALLVMAWIECYIRERMLNRRLDAPPPAPRLHLGCRDRRGQNWAYFTSSLVG